MKHLSDEEIQFYLDGNPAMDLAPVAVHLRDCPDCRRAYDDYRSLYVALADDSRVSIPGHAAILEPARGGESERHAPATDRADTMVAAWGIGVAAATAVWVFVKIGGLGPASGQLAGAFAESLHRAAELLAAFGSAIAFVDNGSGVVTMVGLAICAALVLDQFLVARRLTGTGFSR